MTVKKLYTSLYLLALLGLFLSLVGCDYPFQKASASNQQVWMPITDDWLAAFPSSDLNTEDATFAPFCGQSPTDALAFEKKRIDGQIVLKSINDNGLVQELIKNTQGRVLPKTLSYDGTHYLRQPLTLSPSNLLGAHYIEETTAKKDLKKGLAFIMHADGSKPLLLTTQFNSLDYNQLASILSSITPFDAFRSLDKAQFCTPKHAGFVKNVVAIDPAQLTNTQSPAKKSIDSLMSTPNTLFTSTADSLKAFDHIQPWMSWQKIFSLVGLPKEIQAIPTRRYQQQSGPIFNFNYDSQQAVLKYPLNQEGYVLLGVGNDNDLEFVALYQDDKIKALDAFKGHVFDATEVKAVPKQPIANTKQEKAL